MSVSGFCILVCLSHDKYKPRPPKSQPRPRSPSGLRAFKAPKHTPISHVPISHVPNPNPKAHPQVLLAGTRPRDDSLRRPADGLFPVWRVAAPAQPVQESPVHTLRHRRASLSRVHTTQQVQPMWQAWPRVSAVSGGGEEHVEPREISHGAGGGCPNGSI